MLACTDIAFLTLDDEDMLWGEKPLEQVIDRTQALGVSEIIIKRGADSCIVWVKKVPKPSNMMFPPSNCRKKTWWILPQQETPSAPVIWLYA